MMLSVRQAAKFLGISEKTVYRWIMAGKVPHTRLGDQYRFNRQELLAWAASVGRPVPAEAMREEATLGAPMPSLSEAIHEGGIHYRIGGETPEQVINEISQLIKLPPGTDTDYLRRALIARESVAPTAIGEGIAIPHMRHPLLTIDTPLVGLGFLSRPVEWGALDNRPVRFIFVPCSPSIRCHLHILSRIAFACRNPLFRECLEQEAMRGEILATLETLEAELRNR